MARRIMLIDASAAGETRVALVDGNQLLDYDFEDASKRQVKSSIFLAQVTRVEPSLQAAFLEYGSLKQGFLALPEIHPDYYKIPVADREQLNAALKQSAAEIQAEIDKLVDAEGTGEMPMDFQPSMDDDGYQGDGFPQNNIVAAEAPQPMLSNMGRGELVSSLSELLDAPMAPLPTEHDILTQNDFLIPGEEAIPSNFDVQENNFEQSDDAEQGNAEHLNNDIEDNNDGDAGQDVSHPSRGRGRSRWGRREPLDPEAMAAARRRQLLRSYKIQEVIKRRQVMLVQVNKEERGTKGAALTTYISLPGRYCVLMPNSSNAGGVSRKITNPADRRRMKELISGLQIPEGMGVILRTAGLEVAPEDIARDLDYLLRLWDNICALTMKSTAPALIYEEGDLITRAIRDLYNDDIAEVMVSGQAGYESARAFMEMLLPHHADRVKLYDNRTPLFTRYRVDEQIDAVHEPIVQLPSGGYIVINQTEALVAIDVNSGRATRERNIEETAYRTNLEAAAEVARQLRLRDLAGLIVVDFIDMEDHRHRIGVERRMRDAMKVDRARTQIGRISMFGLLELSRQRLRPSVVEAHFARCETCAGTGWVRSPASAARHILRAIEQELSKGSLERLTVMVHSKLALALLNQSRMQIVDLEEAYKTNIVIDTDDSLAPPAVRFDRFRGSRAGVVVPATVSEAVSMRGSMADNDDTAPENDFAVAPPVMPMDETAATERGSNTSRRRYRGRGARADEAQPQAFDGSANSAEGDRNQSAMPEEDEVTPIPAPPGTEFGVRSGRGRGRGRGRGPARRDGGPADSQTPMPDMAGTEQPNVEPGAFTHHKQEMWGTAPVDMAASSINISAPAVTPEPAPMPMPAEAHNPMPHPQGPAVTTSPIVTRVSASGEAAADQTESDDGPARKGWWNKLMKV